MSVMLKVPDFLLNKNNGPIDMDGSTFQIALSNTAPGSEAVNPLLPGNGVLTNVTQIAYTNYGDNLTVDRVLQGITSGLVAGTYVFDAADVIITPSGGALANFRYIYGFAQRGSAPINPLIFCGDCEATISLAAGVPFQLRWPSNGIIREV